MTIGSSLISKRCSKGKRICLNDKVIAATEGYFKAKNKSFYKHGNEKLESVGMIVSHLNVIMLINKTEFCETNVVFLVSLGTCWMKCYIEAFVEP